MIKEIIEGTLPVNTVAVLTNAVHLRAQWAQPFGDTRPGVFRGESGETTVDMLPGGSGTARTAAGWTAVDLPYRDGTLTAVALLPPEGVDPCSVDLAVLDDVAAGEGRPVDVVMPALVVNQRHDLMTPLTAMGLPSGGYPALCTDCSVDGVVQQAVLEVDEGGTEAAAATAVMMLVSAEPPPPRETVTFDRPYVLVLTDTATRSPLFTAVITKPTS